MNIEKTFLFINRHVLEFILLMVMFMFLLGMKNAYAADQAWSVRCDGQVGDANSKCEMFQRLVEKGTSKRFAEFAIGFPEGRDTARGALILPLGILVNEGSTIQIDDGPVFAFRVRYCVQDGCFAFIDLNEKVINEMRKGMQANLSIKTYDGTPVTVPMSLVGFTKALKDIKQGV